jgi:hypothetical protein
MDQANSNRFRRAVAATPDLLSRLEHLMHSISSQEPSADKDLQWKRLEAMLALHEVQVNTPALSSATELMQAQSIEYQHESDRLKELLSLSGLDLATLDASLGPSLSSIAEAATELGLAGHALSNLELSANVAWGQMAIDDARSTNRLLEIRKTPLGLSGEGGEEVKKSVKHHALVAQHEDLEAAQARCREAQGRLEAFHGLPATQHGAEMLVAQARQNAESMQRLLHTALGLQH